MGSISDFLRRLWAGKASKNEALVYFTLVLWIYGIGIIYAASVYPGGFSLFTVYTSYLGGLPENPPGHLFYNICMFISGILMVPHFLFVFDQLKPRLKLLNGFQLFLGILGCAGFASLGIYYQGFDYEGHKWATILAFGGFGGHAFLMLLIGHIRIFRHELWPKIWKLWLPYILMIITFLLTEFLATWTSDPRFGTDQFKEWLFILLIIEWLYGAIIIIEPQNKPKIR